MIFGYKLKFKKTKKTDLDNDKLFLFDLISHFGLNFEEIIDTLKSFTFIKSTIFRGYE